MTKTRAPNKALIILHQAHSTPGRVGRWLKHAGYELDIRRPSMGDALPASLERHAGVVVFGGPMCANDADLWLRREIDWLGVPLKEDKPYLGLCLGAQLLAKRLGARVFSHDDRRCEVGYYPVHPTAAGDALCATAFPRRAYQWHHDGFDIARGATLLARGDSDFPHQAFRYGQSAVGLQFHPEVTYHMMCRWTTHGHERLTHLGARPAHEHLHGWYQHDHAVGRWLDAFLSAWIKNALPTVEAERASLGEGGRATPLQAAAAPEF